MGGPDEIVSAYFRAEEDATRKSTAVISDAERRTNRHLLRSIEGDPGSADFHRGHAGSGINGEDRIEHSLRGLGGICPEHTGQIDPSRLGGTMGSSSSGRDHKANQGKKQRQGGQNQGGRGGRCPSI